MMQARLSDRLHIYKATMVALLNGLEQQGLVACTLALELSLLALIQFACDLSLNSSLHFEIVS